MKTSLLAARITIFSGLTLAAGWLVYSLSFDGVPWRMFPVMLIVMAICSLPVLIALAVFLPIIRRVFNSYDQKIYGTVLLCGVCASIYGALAFLTECPWRKLGHQWPSEAILFGMSSFAILFGSSLVALFLSKRQLAIYFKFSKPLLLNNKNTFMETPDNEAAQYDQKAPSRSTRILFKGAITVALIGLMMIPTVFISDLVQERQARNEAVVSEVDSRWALAQTLSGPYIFLPYKTNATDAYGKPVMISSHLMILPENKQVNGKINHEIRERSIYKVLLYRASLSDQGNFVFNLPKQVTAEQVQWSDARICFGISDFKGIEEKMVIRYNGVDNELSPGLPEADAGDKGLSAPIALSPADLGKQLPYQMNLKIKGSEMLHFIPLSGNSHYALSSDWPSPSFDGSNLPSERTVNDKGFDATWNFNKANLPFNTVLNDPKFDASALSFGVSMIEPADQYAKTNRSIKYAILIIGLTFSLFFIIELMQRKPIHPVQYVLIGLALVIFYSLLLAISEFLAFDFAYLIASSGTVLLIGLYAKAHFNSWRSAGIFTGVLSLLYGFIFLLISLEDTALLVGSIGLFIILALTMYGSKKVNWYSNAETPVVQ